jgi:hypothetical protein
MTSIKISGSEGDGARERVQVTSNDLYDNTTKHQAEFPLGVVAAVAVVIHTGSIYSCGVFASHQSAAIISFVTVSHTNDPLYDDDYDDAADDLTTSSRLSF